MPVHSTNLADLDVSLAIGMQACPVDVLNTIEIVGLMGIAGA
jgi:hypothetical protein